MTEKPPPHALLRPRIAIPFLLVGLIWGSTWVVLADQLRGPSPSWSVALRFAIAAPIMFGVAIASRSGLALGARGHLLALVVGVFQFTLNYNCVYRAEQHLTSGIVGVMTGLIIVPNAVFGKLLLGERMTLRFVLGSLLAVAGVGLLLTHEAMAAGPMRDVGVGIAFSLAGVLAASLSNVIQANDTGRSLPMTSMIAWAMFYGTLANLLYAYLDTGLPELPGRPGYWLGIAYLAVFGSVVTFPLFFRLVRELGAGRASYNSIIVLIVAMALSTGIEGYRWSWLSVSGATLCLAGLLLALRARNPAR